MAGSFDLQLGRGGLLLLVIVTLVLLIPPGTPSLGQPSPTWGAPEHSGGGAPRDAGSPASTVLAHAAGQSGLSNVNLSGSPVGSLYDPSNGLVYVLEPFANNVVVLNGTTIAATIPVGTYPDSAAFDPTNGWVYVVDYIGNAVSVINGTTIVATVSLPLGNPHPIAYDAQNGEFYVGDENGGGRLSVINGTRLVANFTLAQNGSFNLLDVAYDPYNRGIYVAYYVLVAGYTSSGVGEVRGTTVVGLVNLTSYGSPNQLSVNPKSGLVYVAFGCGSNPVDVVLNGTTVVGTPRVASAVYCGGPGVFDAQNGFQYMVSFPLGSPYNVSDGLVEVLNGTQIVTEITVGPSPLAPIFDPSDGVVYIPNSGSDNVSLIEGTGTLGSVVGGRGPSSVVLDSATGEIYVANANSNNVSVFPAWTPVSVHESGLPAGTSWWFNLTRFPPSVAPDHASATATNDLALPNGSYRYALGSGNRSFEGSAGGFSVAHQGVAMNVTFVRVLENLTFREAGLDPGVNWSVRLGTLSATSNGTSLSFAVQNGSYPYSVAGVAGWTTPHYTGTVRVLGPVDVDVVWSRVTYPVRFTPHGLTHRTGWAVLIGSASGSSVGGTITLMEPNGTFGYVVPPVQGFVANTSGSVTVKGTSVNVSITFRPQTYPVVFIEFGLPAGTNWSVTVTNSTRGFNETLYTSGSSILFFLANGTYNITYHIPPGYATGSTSSQITVAGKSLSAPSLNVAPHNGPANTGPVSNWGSWTTLLLVALLAALIGPHAGVMLYRERQRKRTREFIQVLSDSEWENTPDGGLRRRPPTG